jgi:hypothetical protein
MQNKALTVSDPMTFLFQSFFNGRRNHHARNNKKTCFCYESGTRNSPFKDSEVRYVPFENEIQSLPDFRGSDSGQISNTTSVAVLWSSLSVGST